MQGSLRRIFAVVLILVGTSLFAEEEVAVLSRADNFSSASLEHDSDTYFEGYLQALVDMHYHEYKVVVIVKDNVVYLANLPKNELTRSSIIQFVKDVPGVGEVKVVNGLPPKEIEKREKYVKRPQPSGTWFPQMTVLFQPLIANPREITYSFGYRIGDDVIGSRVVPVSLGDIFTIYRWHNVIYGGDIEAGITAGIWSVFNMNVKGNNFAGGTELANTDYFVALTLAYAHDRWSSRYRFYHISSHLGDEFLVNHPGYPRVNPSMEAMDIFVSYQALFGVRLYGGFGWIFHWDDSYPLKPLYIAYGAEFRFLGTRFLKQSLYGTFFIAGYIQNYQYQHWNFDETVVAGYEWSKLQGIGRKVRVYFQYHHGYSAEGQFSKDKSSYVAYVVSYGF